MSRWRTLAWGTTGGVVAGAAMALLVVTTWEVPEDTIGGDEAAARFVAAWERSMRETYYVASEFRRTTPNGELEGIHEIAQRPPDQVIRQFGGLNGRIGDHPILCTSDPEERVSCVRGDVELEPYDQTVDDAVVQWGHYFEGEPPLYRVQTAGDGCYDLRLVQVFPSPPYGRNARFCFDDATGAIVYSEVRKDEGTDVRSAVEVRSAVSAGDFALPQ
jgi:hypothetical protein